MIFFVFYFKKRQSLIDVLKLISAFYFGKKSSFGGVHAKRAEKGSRKESKEGFTQSAQRKKGKKLFRNTRVQIIVERFLGFKDMQNRIRKCIRSNLFIRKLFDNRITFKA